QWDPDRPRHNSSGSVGELASVLEDRLRLDKVHALEPLGYTVVAVVGARRIEYPLAKLEQVSVSNRAREIDPPIVRLGRARCPSDLLAVPHHREGKAWRHRDVRPEDHEVLRSVPQIEDHRLRRQ